MTINCNDVLYFWFEELSPKQHWIKSTELDATIQNRFSDTHQKALACELNHWREMPEGRLAEIIVLDQFSRNIFRNDARAYASDSVSLALAQEAIRIGDDLKLSITKRKFVYMPFMHSESKTIHETAVRLFQQAGLDDNLDFEYKHKVIIDRFGRYPHRNPILGRESTTEEIAFLNESDSSF